MTTDDRLTEADLQAVGDASWKEGRAGWIAAVESILTTRLQAARAEAAAEALEQAAEAFRVFAESDQNEANSKSEDDPDHHYWDGCADANRQRADDLRGRAAEFRKQDRPKPYVGRDADGVPF